MKIILKLLLLTFLFFIVELPVLAGGGWVHSKGKGYFKLSQWWVVADKHYSDTGDTEPNLTMGTLNTSIYGEYGITDRLNLQLYFPFFSRSFHNAEVSNTTGMTTKPGRAVNSIGDTDIGLKYGFLTDTKIVISGHLWLGLPLGKSDIDPNYEVQLLTGDGEFNQIIGFTASTSQSIGSTNTFASLGFEFNNRTNGFSDETRLNFEIGAVIKERLILVYKLRWLNSLKNGTSDAGTGTNIFSNNTEYLAYTYEIAYNFTSKFGITFNYGSVYSAKLIFASPSYSGGIYMNL